MWCYITLRHFEFRMMESKKIVLATKTTYKGRLVLLDENITNADIYLDLELLPAAMITKDALDGIKRENVPKIIIEGLELVTKEGKTLQYKERLSKDDFHDFVFPSVGTEYSNFEDLPPLKIVWINGLTLSSDTDMKLQEIEVEGDRKGLDNSEVLLEDFLPIKSSHRGSLNEGEVACKNYRENLKKNKWMLLGGFQDEVFILWNYETGFFLRRNKGVWEYMYTSGEFEPIDFSNWDVYEFVHKLANIEGAFPENIVLELMASDSQIGNSSEYNNQLYVESDKALAVEGSLLFTVKTTYKERLVLLDENTENANISLDLPPLPAGMITKDALDGIKVENVPQTIMEGLELVIKEGRTLQDKERLSKDDFHDFVFPSVGTEYSNFEDLPPLKIVWINGLTLSSDTDMKLQEIEVEGDRKGLDNSEASEDFFPKRYGANDFDAKLIEYRRNLRTNKWMLLGEYTDNVFALWNPKEGILLRCEGGTWKVMDKSDELKLLDCHIGYRLRLFILYHLFAIPEALPVRNAESLQTALDMDSIVFKSQKNTYHYLNYNRSRSNWTFDKKAIENEGAIDDFHEFMDLIGLERVKLVGDNRNKFFWERRVDSLLDAVNHTSTHDLF